MEIVINKCYGGFGLSDEAQKLLDEYSGKHVDYYDVIRNDFNLVKVVRELGERANGRFAKLSIVTIPDDVEWNLEEYDGMEWISEKHRTWE